MGLEKDERKAAASRQKAGEPGGERSGLPAAGPRRKNLFFETIKGYRTRLKEAGRVHRIEV
jgi:hypothetical protein